MQTFLKQNLPQIIEVLKNHRVKRAYAFGSVCTDAFDNDSDVDLLISFDITEPFKGYTENFWEMEEQLQKLLNRHVDLIPDHTLKNPYFIKEMEKTKTLLYE